MAETRELLDACVHCGFCLPACPTYTLWGDEMDSPRGRIHLMNLVDRGEIELDATVATHFDRCLGCLACVPACPSGVRYDILIQRARAERRERAPRSLRQRAVEGGVLALAARPRLLRALAWPLATGVRPFPLAPRVSAADLRARPPGSCPPGARCGCGRRCSRAACSGCSSGASTAPPPPCSRPTAARWRCRRARAAAGRLRCTPGREEEARRRAQATIAALGGFDRVVVTAAGCGSAMKEYGELLGHRRGAPLRGRRSAT